MLSAAAFGIRAAVPGTTLFAPGQIAFGKDMILRTQMETNIELIRRRWQATAEKNNAWENKWRITCRCQKGDKVLLLPNRNDPKSQLNQGPFTVLSYNRSNGVLRIQRGKYVEPIHARLVRPYFGRNRGGDWPVQLYQYKWMKSQVLHDVKCQVKRSSL